MHYYKILHSGYLIFVNLVRKQAEVNTYVIERRLIWKQHSMFRASNFLKNYKYLNQNKIILSSEGVTIDVVLDWILDLLTT
jgi:hypothetical protein